MAKASGQNTFDGEGRRLGEQTGLDMPFGKNELKISALLPKQRVNYAEPTTFGNYFWVIFGKLIPFRVIYN